MTKPPSLRAGASAAMAELIKTRLTTPPPTSALAAPPPTSDCDAHKCPWWPYTNSKEFKANTALIVLVLFCALICALALNAAIRYIMRLHCGGSERKAETGGGGAEERAEVPELIYAEGLRLGGEATECVICLSEFVAGERIRVLGKCNHGFHAECVQRWLASRSSCPTCRTNCVGEELASV